MRGYQRKEHHDQVEQRTSGQLRIRLLDQTLHRPGPIMYTDCNMRLSGRITVLLPQEGQEDVRGIGSLLLHLDPHRYPIFA